jgi:hypothetical protein
MHTAFRFQLAKPSGTFSPSLVVPPNGNRNVTQQTAKGEAKADP